ncbi:hypothetical protein RIF29_16886 [Crotalaria pallida]|uniref:Uncharacterized protein n=1 Tax=Crotalaria pallida TaxID=3830 RepID=A0AAN9FHG2_CROPI
MISFQKVLGGGSPKTEVVPTTELEASSKKRKWEEPFTEELFKDRSNGGRRKSIFDIELHLQTPLPSHNWQQYLSIQSGQIHLCNTRVNNNSSNSKRSPEPEHEPPSNNGQMSLDLELNLTYKSLIKKEDNENNKNFGSIGSGSTAERDLFTESNKCKKDSPSWLSSISEGDNREMVATVCMRCHMLVMLCKLSPSCPNCKFMHPPDHNPSKFLKRRRCSLLC